METVSLVIKLHLLKTEGGVFYTYDNLLSLLQRVRKKTNLVDEVLFWGCFLFVFFHCLCCCLFSFYIFWWWYFLFVCVFSFFPSLSFYKGPGCASLRLLVQKGSSPMRSLLPTALQWSLFSLNSRSLLQAWLSCYQINLKYSGGSTYQLPERELIQTGLASHFLQLLQLLRKYNFPNQEIHSYLIYLIFSVSFGNQAVKFRRQSSLNNFSALYLKIKSLVTVVSAKSNYQILS